MKKTLLYFILLGLIVSACSNDTETTSQGKSESSSNESEAVEEQKAESEENAENENSHEEEIEEKAEAKYKVTENWSLVPIKEGANEDVVLLTIDDAPDKHAVEMAKTLKELDAKAIFFVNGHFLDTPEEEKMLKEIHDMGFFIGNHTYNHVTIPEVSEEVQKEEIVSLNDRVEEIIGERPVFFRAPHGANTDYSTQVAEAEGMTVMNWTYGYDYFKPYMNAEKLTTAMVTGEGPEVDVPYSLLKPGANLLMHDREWTKEALPDIVKGLRDKGYEMLDPALIKIN
ncbi:polysaccharide deacetylase family protein [Oceanobacillus rekensis]|uniref:polysaccharide deacetylase family protein n=1 Tax=Oceanobacillus rekensis TaxID=937927 RepID=UPI000B43DB4B|nr:polysaccharide deacetylase family protein [Oceanobacillus rekensis]